MINLTQFDTGEVAQSCMAGHNHLTKSVMGLLSMRELTACDMSCHADSSLKYEPSQFSFLADICARFILISSPRSCHCFVHTGCKIDQRSGSIVRTFQRNAHLRAFCRMSRCYRAILTPAKVRRKRGGIWSKVKPNILQVAH